MQPLDLKPRALRLIEKPAHRVHPAIKILDLCGIRPIDIARLCGVTPVCVTEWRQGTTHPVGDHELTLINACAGAIVAAVEVLGETAADNPDIAASEGYKQYAARIAEARKLHATLLSDIEGRVR